MELKLESNNRKNKQKIPKYLDIKKYSLNNKSQLRNLKRKLKIFLTKIKWKYDQSIFVRYAAKAELREKFIVINACMRKEKI